MLADFVGLMIPRDQLGSHVQPVSGCGGAVAAMTVERPALAMASSDAGRTNEGAGKRLRSRLCGGEEALRDQRGS